MAHYFRTRAAKISLTFGLLLLAATAQAAVTSGALVRRVKIYDGGTIHVTFDRGVCGAQTWAKVDFDDIGANGILQMALSAKLANQYVDVETSGGANSGNNCKLEYLQVQD